MNARKKTMNVGARTIWVWLFLGFLVMGIGTAPASGNATFLSVQPPTKTIYVSQTFSLSVSVTNVLDLYAFQFDLGFDPSVLSVTNVSEGAFLPTGGPTFFIPGTIDNAGGTVTFNADTLESAVAGVNGSGVLATFDFRPVSAGTSQISIFNVILLDSTGAGIEAGTGNGNVSVSAVPEPSSVLLFGTGMMGLASAVGRRLRG